MTDPKQGQRELYPAIEPYDRGRLAVGDGHELYYEQSGDPKGKPVVFLHGGPGGAAGAQARRFFDPGAYRIVLFHQRGCGQSRPHASLVANTTWHLVEDIERLREHLGIERWQVFGGSWGSALALAYAQRHPDRVYELVLRGIFTLRRRELEWFYQEGASRLFPDAWQDYLAPIPPNERGDMMSAYYRRLTGDDEEQRLRAAKAWSAWEGRLSFLLEDPDHVAATRQEQFALAFARIEAHYFVHGGFFERDAQLIEDAAHIRHIPGVIVHGRYDVICPVETAWALHQRWPEAALKIVPDAGHSAFEPGIRHELLEATDRFRP